MSQVMFGFAEARNFRHLDWGAALAENRHYHPIVGRLSTTPEIARIEMSGNSDSAFIRLPDPVFKRACNGIQCVGAAYQRLHAGYRMGTLTAFDGTALPALVEFNLGRTSTRPDAPVSVKYWENGRKHDLFAQTELQ